MSQAQKIDYEIMQSLNSLLEFEMQDALKEDDFKTYKVKSKAVLAKLLVKLEDDAEYRRYLEGEVKRLEDSERQLQQNATADAARTAQHNEQLRLELEQKDAAINKLREELAQSQQAFAEYQEMRKKEMQTVAVVCSALTSRIKALNINFESGGDEEEEDASAGEQSPQD